MSIAKQTTAAVATNWVTTLGGVMSAVGALVAQSEDETTRLIATIIMSLGLLLTGGAARQSNKSSAESHAE